MMRFVSVQDRVLATVWTVPRVPVLLTVGPWRRGVQDRIDCILEDHSSGWERRMFFSPILDDENLWSSTSSIGGFVPCGWDPSCMDLPLCSGGSHVSGSRPQQWFLLFHDGRMEIRSMDGITVPSFLPSSTPPHNTSFAIPIYPCIYLVSQPWKRDTCGIHPHRIPWSLFSQSHSHSHSLWLWGEERSLSHSLDGSFVCGPQSYPNTVDHSHVCAHHTSATPKEKDATNHTGGRRHRSIRNERKNKTNERKKDKDLNKNMAGVVAQAVPLRAATTWNRSRRPLRSKNNAKWGTFLSKAASDVREQTQEGCPGKAEEDAKPTNINFYTTRVENEEEARKLLFSDVRVTRPHRGLFSSREWTSKDKIYGAYMLAVHLGALAAPLYFSWGNVALFLGMYFVTGCLGITLSYHRQLTHRSFQTPKWLEYIFAYCGVLAVEGDPVEWASSHRYHHKYCDTEYDPHSPYEGFFYSHMGWLLDEKATLERVGDRKNSQDLASDPFYAWLQKTYPVHVIGSAVAMYMLGGMGGLIWGFCLRVVWVYHITWFVNSATHVWGDQPYKTGDLSRNNWWVGLLAFGEGWHNNHHAFEYSARHGLEWWQFDMTWLVIKALESVGLASKIKLPTQEQLDRLAV